MSALEAVLTVFVFGIPLAGVLLYWELDVRFDNWKRLRK